jgi:hypothetical protein
MNGAAFEVIRFFPKMEKTAKAAFALAEFGERKAWVSACPLGLLSPRQFRRAGR